MTSIGLNRLPTSLVSVLLVGLPLIIVSESIHLGYYVKLVLLHAGMVSLVALALLGKYSWHRSRIALPAILLLFVTTISIVESINRVESVVVIGHRFSLLITILLVPSLLDRRAMTNTLKVLGLVTGLTSAIGIAQYAGWAGLGIPTSGLPSSTFGYRNNAAAFTIAVIPFIIAELFRQSSTTLRAGWGLVLFLNTSFLVATRTRAAWAACLVSLVVCLALWGWKWKQAPRVRPGALTGALLTTGLAILCAGIFAVTVPPSMNRRGYDRSNEEKTTVVSTIASTFEPGADKDRYDMWANTLLMIADNPLLGVGAGNWQYSYPSYDKGEAISVIGTPRRPHNDYLWIAAESGITGLLIAVWLGLAIAGAARRVFTSARDQDTSLVATAALSSIVAIACHACFSFPLERVPVTFVAALSLAVIARLDPQSRTTSMRPLASLGLACLTALFSTVIAWRAVRFDRMALHQVVSVDRRDWAGGVTHGSAALGWGVFDPQIYLLRGLSHHMLGAYAQAIDDQRACLSYHPYLVNAINNLGMSLNAAGRYDDALDALLAIDGLSPNHVEVHLNRSRAYQGKGDERGATAELRRAHDKAPGNDAVTSELASRLEGNGDFDEAARILEAASLAGPERVTYHYRLGVIRQKQARHGQAARHFRQVLTLDRTHVPVLFNLGELYAATGDTARAVQAFEAFMSRWDGAEGPRDAVRQRLADLK